MLIQILLVAAILVVGNFVVSYIRSLKDDFNYIRQDLNRYIDHYESR